MGVISEVISSFSPQAGLRVYRGCILFGGHCGLRLLGLGAPHVHHGCLQYSALVFSLLTMLVAVPSAIKIFNWSATLYKGSITFETPMLYAFGFMGLFTIGGMTGVFLASLGMDIHLTETYFIVAHFHFVMVGGMLMALPVGRPFLVAQDDRPNVSGVLSQLAAVITFIGFILTFFPQFILGYLGMPRRYHAYPPEFQVLNVLSTAGATSGHRLSAAMLYLPWSLKYGRLRAAIPGRRPAWSGRCNRPR